MRINKLILLILLLVSTLSFKEKPIHNKSNKSERMKIEVWSDVVCPFCLIGKKKLEKAIKSLNAEDKIEIVWRSFQLDPNIPENNSIPSLSYLSERKGYPLESIKSMCNQLKENGKEYGVDFKFEQALTFNTSKAHQLIKWANLYGKSSEVKEALMIAHFSKGMDLSDPNSILEVVKELNLNTSEANTVLKSNEYWEEVQEDIKMASERKITGVPYFVINNQQSISGAQSDEVFISIINSALNNLGSSNTTKSAKVCKPQTGCE